MHTDASVRFIGGASMPRSFISLRSSGPASGCATADCDADPDQTVGVVHRLPGVNGQPSAGVVAGHAVVAGIQLGAGIDQHLNDGRPSLVPGAVQRRASGFGLDIRVDAQVQQQLAPLRRWPAPTTRR